MEVPNVIFREYDVRGVVGEQLTPQLGVALGRAFVGLLRNRGFPHAPRVAVGRDNRPSGDRLASAVRDGIALAGGIAIDVGELPTPALYFSVKKLQTDAGLQVTGSHNPPEFNGFKMLTADEPVYGAAIEELYDLIKSDAVPATGDGSLERDETILDTYVDAVVERHGTLDRPVKVVVDCGNGVASLVAERILGRMQADVVPLFCESDGSFPNHHPDPTVVENLHDLQEAVRVHDAELGIAFDGDGDRIGAVDDNGQVVFGDQLLILLGRDLVHRMGKGHPVIFDVKCSQVLADELERAGLKPVIWKTGHSLIKSKMKETNAPLAGEMSGHMFFAGDYYGFDDALFAAARLLSYVARAGGPLSKLMKDVPQTVATPEIRVDCDDHKKFAVVAAAADHFGAKYEVLKLDGARISFADGWGLIRASNTQPVIVMRFEATDEPTLKRYRAEVEDWLREQGVEL